MERLNEFLKNRIASVELEQEKTTQKPKTNVKALKEKQRRLTIAYVAGNIPDAEYLRDDAELKSLIAKAEATAPPEPQDITPLKELLETDFKSVYEIMSEEEKQRFWQRLIKEIKLDGKKIKDVIFF